MNYNIPHFTPIKNHTMDLKNSVLIRIKNDFDEIIKNLIKDVIVEIDSNNAYGWNLIFNITDHLYFGQILFPGNYPYKPPQLKLCRIPDLEEPKKTFYLPLFDSWSPINTSREIVLAAVEIIWRFCKPGPMVCLKNLKSLQCDVFRDIMQCLSKFQMEKCQLVCKSWQEFLVINEEIFPRRVFKALAIECKLNLTEMRIKFSAKLVYKDAENPGFYEYFVAKKDEEIGAMGVDSNENFNQAKIKALPGAFFEEITLSILPQEKYMQLSNPLNSSVAEHLLNFIQKLVEIHGEPLNAFSLRDQIEDSGHFSSTTQFLAALYPKLFDYFQFEKFIQIICYKQNMGNFFTYLESFINISNPTFTIELICKSPGDTVPHQQIQQLQQHRQFLINLHIQRIPLLHRENENNSLRFSEFIHGLLDTIDDLHGFTLKTTCNEFDWHLENLCKKLIEVLKSTNKLDKLPAEINIEFHEGAGIMEFIQRLFREEKTLEKEAIRSDDLLKEVVFKRDQWYLSMAMEYNNNARGSVKALRLKFLHS